MIDLTDFLKWSFSAKKAKPLNHLTITEGLSIAFLTSAVLAAFDLISFYESNVLKYNQQTVLVDRAFALLFLGLGFGVVWQIDVYKKSKNQKPSVVKKDYIIVEPEVLAGKPVIRGTRIPVYLILKLLEDGKSIKDIVGDYPELDEEAVKAAIRYAQEVLKRQETVLK